MPAIDERERISQKSIDETNHHSRRIRIVILLLSITIVSFLLKYVSEWTHEFLGHCGFGWLAGGAPQSWYVSWIWPLEFGYASVAFPISTGPIPRAVMMIGGIAACLIAAFTSHSIIFINSRKKILPQGRISTAKLCIFHALFWYGFWAFANSVGYLIIGGLADFGDIYMFRIYTGLPSWVLILLGFLAFFTLYYLISFNASIIFRPLLPHTSLRKILSTFWLSIPLLFLLIFLNPDINVLLWMIPAGIGFAFIPSLLIMLVGEKFPNKVNWMY